MLSGSLLSSVAFVSAFIVLPAAAQTWTSCNPLNSTCPGDPALGTSANFNLSDPDVVSNYWNQTAGSLTYDDDSAQFTINKQGDSPTLQSQFYYFFGVCEVIMKAASGQGIISSIVLESDDLDEVDWEVIGGNTTSVETNYFGKGNTTTYDRAVYYAVDNPQADYHNYTTHWTAEAIDWYIDGKLVRTLKYADANGGKSFPQTPMTVRVGIWAGGDPTLPAGVQQWAGGQTNFADGPFTMSIKSIRVQDYSKGSFYTFGDRSGSWQSVKIESGNSTAAQQLSAPPAPPPQSIGEKFNGLSTAAKIGIYVGIGAAGLIFLALITFCCTKQRRIGRGERLVEDQKFDQSTAELMNYRKDMSTTSDPTTPAQGQETGATEKDKLSHDVNTIQSPPMSPSAALIAGQTQTQNRNQYARPGQFSQGPYNPPEQYSQPVPAARTGQYGQQGQFTQSIRPGRFSQPGQFSRPGQFAQSNQFSQPGQYARPSQYAQPSQYPQSRQYAQPSQNGQQWGRQGYAI